MSGKPNLSPTQAERAIYIDFEGTEKDPPSLLGTRWTDDKERFIQYVLEPELWPAADAAAASVADTRRATWSDLADIRRVAESEDRRVVAWSTRERTALREHLTSADDQDWFGENVINAIPFAKRWKRRFHSEIEFPKDDPRRGRHRLDRYLALIGYQVPRAFGPGNSAQRIRSVRVMLEKKGGDYAALTHTVKGKWTKALRHNWYDCDGLRKLTIRCATDLG